MDGGSPLGSGATGHARCSTVSIYLVVCSCTGLAEESCLARCGGEGVQPRHLVYGFGFGFGFGFGLVGSGSGLSSGPGSGSGLWVRVRVRVRVRVTYIRLKIGAS